MLFVLYLLSSETDSYCAREMQTDTDLDMDRIAIPPHKIDRITTRRFNYQVRYMAEDDLIMAAAHAALTANIAVMEYL